MNAKQLLLGLHPRAACPDQTRNAYIAKALMEDSSGNAKLMESICERENMIRALKRVESNDGAPGIDGMTCRQLRGFVTRTWQASKQALLDGTYRPLPVRGKEIPKPDGGGMRKLGIPAVMDRLVQQATVQPLVAIYDHTFSDSSFGYRPGRSQAQAVERYRQHVEDGYTWVVSLDLSKFFDRVNHHRLMSRPEQRIKDRRVLKLIRAFLKSGIHQLGTTLPPWGQDRGGTKPLLHPYMRDIVTLGGSKVNARSGSEISACGRAAVSRSVHWHCSASSDFRDGQGFADLPSKTVGHLGVPRDSFDPTCLRIAPQRMG